MVRFPCLYPGDRVGDRFHVSGRVDLPTGIEADVVLANILANPLLELAPVLTGLLRPGGNLVLVGMLVPQADKVMACYQDQFSLERRQHDQWVRLAGRKSR